MNSVNSIEWSSHCLLQPMKSKSLDEEVKRSLGFVPKMFAYLYPLPWTARGVMAIYAFVNRHIQHWPSDFGPLMNLVIAQENSCRYCYGSARIYLKFLGYKEAEIRKLEHSLYSVDLSDPEKAGLLFVRKLTRLNPRPKKSDLSALYAAGLTQAAVEELVFYCSINSFLKRFTIPLAVPPEDFDTMDASRWKNPFIPVISFLVKKSVSKGNWSPESTTEITIFSPFTERIASLPTAQRMLQEMIRNCWDSPHLTKRTKALLFAVVGKTLECPLTEQEAKRLLLAEGMDSLQIEAVMTYLHAPVLHAEELSTIRFAIDLLKAPPIRAQALTREFSVGLEPETLLETLGTIGLASCLSKLSVLMED
ncbi:carboxymuconolactone decarboxylase family protein [Paenibacillus sp. HJGM_3]|uniref:carboxymuconolactone decarboxylase family protein n=1 Tax=Paenibacillus sp. HJGM_3 TaxID=3379816 RepID=UPI00385B7BBA